MAEDKKGILVYADWINKFEALNDDEAGKLIKHFFRYVNDLNPVAPDRTTELMFIDIKNTLKRDLEKYINKKEERAYSGKLGNLKKYQKDLYDKVISDKMTIEEAQTIAKRRKLSLSEKSVAKLAVNGSDSVSGNDSVNDINISFEVFWDLYNKKVGDKKACLGKWDKLKDVERENIINTLPIFIAQFSDKQYQPFPATYLNQRRWEDEQIAKLDISATIDKWFELTEKEKQALKIEILKIPIRERSQREVFVIDNVTLPK